MKLRATSSPTDSCCWSAHLETWDGHDVADVCNLETAQEIARAVNAREAIVEALSSALVEIKDGAAIADDRLLLLAVEEKIRAALAALGARS